MSSPRERAEQTIATAAALAGRIAAAVEADYPDLWGWRMRLAPIRRTGPGPDDWRWDRSQRARVRRAEAFLREAVGVAASRISEAYGLGAGAAWAIRHGLPLRADPDSASAAAVLASVAAVLRYR